MKISKTINVSVDVDIENDDIALAERKRISDRIKYLANKVFNDSPLEYPSNVLDLVAAWIDGWSDMCHSGWGDYLKRAMLEIDKEGFQGYGQPKEKK